MTAMRALDERAVDHRSPYRRRTQVGYTTSAFARSTGALRRLDAEHPRVYAVADMSEQGKRRWWALADGEHSGRFEALFRRSLLDHSDPSAALDQVATALIHSVVGRLIALLALEGRAWDPGVDNLFVHFDSDVGIDWAGVGDTTLRVASDDVLAGSRDVVTLPCEGSLMMWTALRCETSLAFVYEALSALGPLDYDRFWRLVGESVVGGASLVPVIGGGDAGLAWERGQALLDAFVTRGRPVRGGSFRRGVRTGIDRHHLGQAFLYTA